MHQVADHHGPETDDQTAFGRWLRAAREERGITQQALADRAGLSRSYLSDLERGRGVRPTIPTLDRLATALGVANLDLLWAAGILHTPVRGPQRQDEDRLLALYRGLSEHGQGAVERFIKFMYQEEQRWVQPSFADDIFAGDATPFPADRPGGSRSITLFELAPAGDHPEPTESSS
jgi:transcriptional regulator with XRE-family HTH domain